MLENTRQLISTVGRNMGLDDQAIKQLLSIDQEHIFEIVLGSGQRFKAYRVQHNNQHGPYKGGIRFHPSVSLDEIRALATLMSFKTAAVGLPLGGGKGGVSVDPKQLNDRELEELSRGYVRQLYTHIGPDTDVPAPDVNTDSRIIDWMVDEYEQLTGDTSRASFTGKSLSAGGSAGREAATGRGGVIVLQAALKQKQSSNKHLTIAIQGFGNVGAFFATIAAQEEPDWRLVAVSDSSATITAANGFNAKELTTFKSQRGHFSDYQHKGVKIEGAEAIFSQDVDVLVLAALGDVLTKHNMKQVKATYVLELANGPVSNTAYEYLSKQGITIIPDIIANAGGVIVSYLEWLQNQQAEHWPENKVNQQLRSHLVKAIKALYATAEQRQVNLKEAALINAIQRLNSQPG